MRNFVLVPEALVVAGAVALLLLGRFTRVLKDRRRSVPAVVVGLVLIALAVELWAGTALTTFLGGGLVQDRFALFAKAAVLLSVAVAIATADWSAEDSLPIGLAMPLLAGFGVMVAASATDLVGLWAGLELAAAAGVVMVSLRRPDVAIWVLVTGGVATTLLLVGFAFIYAATGTADLRGERALMQLAAPTLPLAIPVLLLLGGLAVRAGLAPFHFVGVAASVSASPVGGGLVLGLVGAAALITSMKVVSVLSTSPPAVYTPYLAFVAAFAILGGGAVALATRSPRARLAYLGVGQVGWMAAGLVSHYRIGLAASLFLLGAFTLAATCGPAAMGTAEGGESGLAGMGTLRPARAAGLALALLSLAGVPPLAGFFGEFAVAAALARSGHFEVLAVGLIGTVMSVAAALGTLRVMYIVSPAEERRGAGTAVPPWTAFSTAGAVALSTVIVAYGVFGSPILGLADQGARALGLR
jgi:NADH-quinone oxidoreductase subunit N